MKGLVNGCEGVRLALPLPQWLAPFVWFIPLMLAITAVKLSTHHTQGWKLQTFPALVCFLAAPQSLRNVAISWSPTFFLAPDGFACLFKQHVHVGDTRFAISGDTAYGRQLAFFQEC